MRASTWAPYRRGGGRTSSRRRGSCESALAEEELASDLIRGGTHARRRECRERRMGCGLRRNDARGGRRERHYLACNRRTSQAAPFLFAQRQTERSFS